MTTTVKNIIPRKLITTGPAKLYTADLCKLVIDKFTLTNTSTDNVEVSVYLTSPGGTDETSNKVLATRVIVPNQVYKCPELIGQSLESSGSIYVECSDSSAVVISATGREIT